MCHSTEDNNRKEMGKRYTGQSQVNKRCVYSGQNKKEIGRCKHNAAEAVLEARSVLHKLRVTRVSSISRHSINACFIETLGERVQRCHSELRMKCKIIFAGTCSTQQTI